MLKASKDHPDQPSDPRRRAVFRGQVAEPLRPPWLVSSSALYERCRQCGDCVSACPENILELDPERYPRVNFSAHGMAECSFCGDCANACPEPLFHSTDTTPWHHHAAINNACLSEQGVVCHSCCDTCPEEAINLPRLAGITAVPTISVADCTGCGACVASCPTSAIHMAPPPPSAV